MAEERVKTMADEALAELAQALERGKSEALTKYLAAMSRFHRYSWGNVLLIASQRPSATQVAGFHTWQQLGRSVKKGEKGIMILAPMLVKQRDSERTEEVPSRESDVTRRLAGFRTAYVFDVEQTIGKPLPEVSKTLGDPKDFGERLKSMLQDRAISLEYDPTIAPAQGVSTGGHIRLLPGMSSAEEFSVLTHELAHELMHHDKSKDSLPKVVRETQAEAVAFVVSRAIGLDTNSASVDYIALYNGNKNTLADSLTAIQETSAQILHSLLTERPMPSQTIDEKEFQSPPNPARSSPDHSAPRELAQLPSNSPQAQSIDR